MLCPYLIVGRGIICTPALSFNERRLKALVRIAFLLTTLGIGGAEKQVISIADHMAARGHVVTLIVLKHAEEEWPTRLPVLRLNILKTPAQVWRGLQFARSFLSIFRPDIVHSHTFPANMFARMLRLKNSSGRRIAIVNTIHNIKEGGWHRLLFYGLTSPLADKVTAVSAAAADRYLRFRAVPVRKIRVLTNGIDTTAFVPDSGRRKRTRTTMRASNNFVWIAVGRLAPAKDYPNLLRAFRDVVASRPSTKLWIAGEGNADPLEQQWFDLTEVENASSVTFLGLRRDIPDLLDAADAFVLASAWEGLPLAVGEAMAMGKVVVATDVGGVREIVGAAGELIAANASHELSEAMLKVMSLSDQSRQEQGALAQKRVQELFSMQAKANEWEVLYQDILGEPRFS